MSDSDDDGQGRGSEGEEEEEADYGEDADDSGSDDDGDQPAAAGGKKKKRGGGGGQDKQSKRARYAHMYDDEAAEDGGDDEEDYDDEHRASAKELNEAEREAHERARRRQEDARRLWEQRSVAEIAADIERRHAGSNRPFQRPMVRPAAAARPRKPYAGGGGGASSGGGASASGTAALLGDSGGGIGGGGGSDEEYHEGESGDEGGYVAPPEVLQQALLPDLQDPKLFVVECKTGAEQQLVWSLMNKAAAFRRDGNKFGILSAVAPGVKGFIYLEAMNEPDVRRSISGMSKIYHSKLRMVPIRDMPNVLTVSAKARPLREGQYVRLIRPPLYKDDLARVEELYDSGSRAVVAYIPRLDLNNIDKNTGKEAKPAPGAPKPPQKLFNPEDVKASGGVVERRKFITNNLMTDAFGNNFYDAGFVIKYVNVTTTLRSTGVNPTIEELQMFRSRKDAYRELHEEEDGEDVGGGRNKKPPRDPEKELMEEFARAQEGDARQDEVPLFAKDDMVVVTEGEMKGLMGVVEDVRTVLGEVLIRIRPTAEEIAHERVDLRPSQLAKFMAVGAHVRVMDGRYTGETGTIVSVQRRGDDSVAVVLTDMSAKELQVRVAQLQETQEVAEGLDSLQGYELYDLVQLSPTEMGVVTMVGREDLQVLNSMDQEKVVRPEEIRGKKNVVSARSVSLDAEQNQVRCGDVVTVIEGKHARHSGTVKHMHRMFLFLHSRSHQQHGGIFVARARSCVLSGNSRATQHSLSNQYMGNIGNSSGAGAPGKDNIVRDVRNRFDALLNKTVKMTTGQFKGLIGTVVEATETHVKVELTAKYKVITVDRSKVREVGDKDGAKKTATADPFARPAAGGWADGGSAWTPYNGTQTPMHGSQTPMHSGAQTPMHSGAETPMHGSMTPSHVPQTPSHDAWKPSADEIGGTSRRDDPFSRGGSGGGGYSDWDADRNAGGGGVGGGSRSGGGGAGGSSGGYGASSSSRSSGGGSSSAVAGGVAGWARRGMYVMIASSGRVGLIESVGKESRVGGGTLLTLRFEDDREKSVGAEECSPAPPSKGDRIEVIAGPNEGVRGKCKSVDGSDVVVKLESGGSGSTILELDAVTRVAASIGTDDGRERRR